jgi:predicted MFS family arabinose efflux permease
MNIRESITTNWQDFLNLLLGLGLFVSPWVFGYTAQENAAGNAYLAGLIVAAMALAALYAFQEWEEWVSGIFGVWLIIAPWVMGFSTVAAAMYSHVVIGIAVLVLAIWSTSTHGSGHLTAGR